MSRHFSYDSDKMLACSCCKAKGMSPSFLDLMDQIRDAVGEPLTVTSGYRCPKHNAKVSSTGSTGPHTTGRAIDIKADSRLRFLLIQAALKQGITRIGVADNFIHIDNLGELDGFPSPRVWVY